MEDLKKDLAVSIATVMGTSTVDALAEGVLIENVEFLPYKDDQLADLENKQKISQYLPDFYGEDTQRAMQSLVYALNGKAVIDDNYKGAVFFTMNLLINKGIEEMAQKGYKKAKKITRNKKSIIPFF